MSYYEVALFVLQKIACTLSAVGSLMIISQIARSQYNRRKTQQRLILGISIIDFQTSIVWIFTPLFMPADSGYPAAVGNRASCDAQGFIVQFSSAGFLYMCALQLMYLLIIKYGWKEREITKLEKWFHIIPIAYGTAVATAGLVLKLYNPANWDCWIAPLPANCTSSHEVNKGNTDLTETDCIRGDNANIYRFAFSFAPLWASILFCIVAMILVHQTMKKSEATYEKFKYSQTNMNGRKGSVEVKRQSIRYAFAFFFVWTFPTIARIVQFFDEVHPILVVLSGTTIGMQGLFNALIYFRPRYVKLVQHKSWYRRVWALVHSTLFFCCYNEDYTKDKLDYVGGSTTRTSSRQLGSTKRVVVSTQLAQLDVGSTQRDVGCTRQIDKDSGERDEEKQEEEADEWHSNGEDGPIQATGDRESTARDSTATVSTQLGSTKRDVVSTQLAQLDVGSTQRDMRCTRQIEEDSGSGERDEEKQEEEVDEWHSSGEDGPIQATPALVKCGSETSG